MILTEAQKKATPKSKRGVPGKSGTGSYPMPDQEHAQKAEALAAMHHGKRSKFTKRIRAKAHQLYPSLGEGKRTLADLR